MDDISTKILSFLLKNMPPRPVVGRGSRRGRLACRLLPLAIGLLALTGCSFYQPPFEFSNPYDPTIQLSATAGSATITVDGDPADWAGIGAVISDPQGDVPQISGESGLDAKAVYLATDANYLYWRIDLWDPPIDPAVHYELTISPPDGTAGTDLHLASIGGFANAISVELDASGTWLSEVPLSGVTVANGAVIEGSVPLQVVAGLSYRIVSLHIMLFDSSETTKLSEDDAGGFDLKL